MKHVSIGTLGETVTAIGLGTWKMGADKALATREIDALRLGIELGLTVIDTAEMYADGGAERIVGDAIRDLTREVFVVSKVWPNHARREDLLKSLDGTLKRIGRDRIDLYLLHWPSREHPLEETLTTLQYAREQGLAHHIGVSNFPVSLLEEAERILGPHEVVANQVEYNLMVRNIEHTVYPWCHQHGTTIMAYSPIRGIAELSESDPRHAILREIAHRHDASPVAVALAWVIHEPGILAIPKATHPDHVRANRAALDITLTAEDIARLHAAFPRTSDDMPLQRL